MKNKSIVSLLCALLGFGALADSYTFTPGTAIPLKDNGDLASYVTLYDQSGNNLKANAYSLDSTQQHDYLILSLNNQTAGNYVLSILGSAGGFETNPTLEITGVTDTTYTKTVTLTQRNTGTNINDNDPYSYSSNNGKAQTMLVALDSLPQGEFTLKLNIVRSWGGNYGYFTFYNVDNGVSNVALDLQSGSVSPATIASSGTAASYVKVSGANFEGSGEQTAIGSTYNNGYIQFSLYCPAKGTCSFSYKSGSKYASTMAWTLAKGEGTVAYTGSDSVDAHDEWTLVDEHTHNFGLLAPGYYVLKGVCTGSAQYNGNFGNFTFTYEASTDLDIDADYTLTDDVANRQVNISGSPLIDLAGFDMTLAQATTALSGTAEITNTSETLSTLTLKNLTDSTLLQGLKLRGNVKLVIDGFASDISFNTNSSITSDSTLANTHTGGTWMQNSSAGRKITIDNTSSFGNGPIAFNGNVKLYYPNSGQSSPTFANDIYVYNAANEFEGAFGSNAGSVNFNGDWYGDGELWMYNSWSPEILINNLSGHNNGNFTGTLLLTYNRDSSRGYHLGNYSTGFPGATVCLTNRYTSGDARTFQVYCQSSADGVVKFGRLMTDQVKTAEGYTQHTNTCLIANHTGNSPLYIGAAQTSASDYDIFSGYLREQTSKTFSLVKEGAGTLELNGQTASAISQGITVGAGTLILNTAVSTATAVIVAEGAQFYGTVPASGSVTYQSGAIIDCDTAHTITGDVDLSGAVVTGSNPVDGQVFLTVTGTVSGTKPVLSDDLKAVRSYDGHSGKWAVEVATSNGVTTYALVWKSSAFVIIIR